MCGWVGLEHFPFHTGGLRHVTGSHRFDQRLRSVQPALSLISASSLEHPDVTGPIVSVIGGLSVAAAALGEEIFFRDFLQGLLDRWRGPHLALWGQAFAFLIPHLLLLLIDVHLYPLVIVQFGVSVLLGWLRLRSGSLWPAAVAHVITNVGTGLLLV